MRLDSLVEGVLSSVMGGRRKRSGRALRYLLRRRGGTIVTASTLLGAAGVAWGIYETLQRRGHGAPPPLPAQPAHGGTTPDLSGVPSLHRSPGQASDGPADPDAMRLVRLAISAARADGVLGAADRAAIVAQAKAAGVSGVVERELEHPWPLADIVAGVTDPAQRATLYALAYTIVRADEQVAGAERIYLAQLASLLDLDTLTVEAIESDVGERIDALGDQGQLGG